jgi:hypothetical protein
MPVRTPVNEARNALVALVSGLASAALVAVADGSLARLLLLALTPLPLLAGGLSAGTLTCLAAGLAGTIAVVLDVGSVRGAWYLGAVAVPAVILVREALRPVLAGDGGANWRSGGALLLWLAGLGVAGVGAVVAWFGLFGGGLATRIGDMLGLQPAAAEMASRIVPGLGVAIWIAVLAVDGMVAEWLTARFGFAIRPPIDVKRLSLPLWIGPILMVMGLAGAALRHGVVGVVCLNSAIVLLVPFAFLGLAMIHALAESRRGGLALVVGAYVVLLASPALLGWRGLLILTLILAGLGSADQLIDFRDLRGLRSGMKRK